MADAREQRYVARGTRGDPGGSSGNAQMLGSLAERLQGVSSQVGRMAHRQITADVDAEKAQIHADVTMDVERLAVEHRDNPTTFQTAARGAIEGSLAGAHSENRGELQGYADLLVSRHFNKLTEIAAAEDEKHKAAQHENGAVTLIEQAGWLAQNGDAEGLAAVESTFFQGLDAATGRRDIDGEPMIDPGTGKPLPAYLSEDRANDLARKYRETVAGRTWVGRFEAARRAGKGESFAKSFRDKPPTDLQGGQWDVLQNRFDADVAQDRTEARARASEAREEMAFRRAIVTDEANDVLAVLNSGNSLPEERVNAAAAMAADGGFPDIEIEIYRARRENAAVRELSVLPLDEFAAAINAQKPESADDVQFQSRLKQAYSQQRAARKTDPLTAGAAAGVVELAAVDPVDPATWASRVDTATRLSTRWKQAVPLLTLGEVDALAEAYQTADVDDQMSVLRAGNEGVGEKRFGEIARQLSERHAGPFAVAASILSEGRGDMPTDKIARDVLIGATVESTLRKAVFPSEPAVDRDLIAAMGNAYEVDDNVKRQVMDAAKLHYLAQQSRKGAKSGEAYIADSGAIADSLEAVSGGIVTWNDSQLVAPRGWTEDNVADWMDGLDAAYLDAHGGVSGFKDAGGSERAAQLIRDTGRLVTVGTGQYKIEVDDAAIVRNFIRDADGNVVVLTAPGAPPAEFDLGILSGQ